MARAKAAQWLKVEGVGWVKFKVTQCPKRTAHGLFREKIGVDMSRRSELHATPHEGPTDMPRIRQVGA